MNARLTLWLYWGIPSIVVSVIIASATGATSSTTMPIAMGLVAGGWLVLYFSTGTDKSQVASQDVVVPGDGWKVGLINTEEDANQSILATREDGASKSEPILAIMVEQLAKLEQSNHELRRTLNSAIAVIALMLAAVGGMAYLTTYGAKDNDRVLNRVGTGEPVESTPIAAATLPTQTSSETSKTKAPSHRKGTESKILARDGGQGLSRTLPDQEADPPLGMSPAVACRAVSGYERFEAAPAATYRDSEELVIYYRPLHFRIERQEVVQLPRDPHVRGVALNPNARSRIPSWAGGGMVTHGVNGDQGRRAVEETTSPTTPIYLAHLTQDAQIRRRGEKAALQRKNRMIEYVPQSDHPLNEIYLTNTVSLKGLESGEYDYDIVLHDYLGYGTTAISTQTVEFRVTGN